MSAHGSAGLPTLPTRPPLPPFTPPSRAPRLVALVGPPNSGKSTLFNRLTGLRQRVANFPGVTVEERRGRARLEGDREVVLVDLPGVYSLVAALGGRARHARRPQGRDGGHGQARRRASHPRLDEPEPASRPRGSHSRSRASDPRRPEHGRRAVEPRRRGGRGGARDPSRSARRARERVQGRGPRDGARIPERGRGRPRVPRPAGPRRHSEVPAVGRRDGGRGALRRARAAGLDAPARRRVPASRRGAARLPRGGRRGVPDDLLGGAPAHGRRGPRRAGVGRVAVGAPPGVAAQVAPPRGRVGRRRLGRDLPAADPAALPLHRPPRGLRLPRARRPHRGPHDAEGGPSGEVVPAAPLGVRVRRAGRPGGPDDREQARPHRDDPHRAVHDVLGAAARLHAHHRGLPARASAARPVPRHARGRDARPLPPRLPRGLRDGAAPEVVRPEERRGAVPARDAALPAPHAPPDRPEDVRPGEDLPPPRGHGDPGRRDRPLGPRAPAALRRKDARDRATAWRARSAARSSRS